MPSTEETIGIETSGNAVELRLQGADTLEVVIRGDASATYEVDVRTKDGSWKQGVRSNYSGSANYADVIDTGAEYIRIRCSSGTATAGDSATITLMAN